MKYTFILPRFHTNISALINGLILSGNQVNVLVAYRAVNENYSSATPIHMGSRFKLNFRGIPLINVCALRQHLKNSESEILIIRGERNLFTLQVFLATLFLKKKIVIYDQYKVIQNYIFLRFFIKVRDLMFNPLLVISPVFDNTFKSLSTVSREIETLSDFEERIKKQLSLKNGNRCWVPFGVESEIRSIKPTVNRSIDFIIVAKFQKRKNVLLVLKALERASILTNIKIAVVYAAITKNDKEGVRCKKEIMEFSQRIHWNMQLSIVENIRNEKMKDLYLDSKYLILVSDDEPASYSNIESSFFGCINILATKNGTLYQHIFNSAYNLFTQKEDLDGLLPILLNNLSLNLPSLVSYNNVLSKYFSSTAVANNFIRLLARN